MLLFKRTKQCEAPRHKGREFSLTGVLPGGEQAGQLAVWPGASGYYQAGFFGPTAEGLRARKRHERTPIKRLST